MERGTTSRVNKVLLKSSRQPMLLVGGHPGTDSGLGEGRSGSVGASDPNMGDGFHSG